MFNRKFGTKSIFISLKNGVLRNIQNTQAAACVRESLFFENIDSFLYIFLMLTLVSCIFCESSYIGIFTLCFSVLQSFKLCVKKGARTKISLYDKAILIFFAFVVLSLFGSTLFTLSLKGFMKTAIYTYFYFSALSYFLDNKNKILPTILVVSGLISFESIIAIIQNNSGILAISGWQDTTNLDPTQVISRAYGTLKPYNPNLLAGYLVTGISSIWCLSMINLLNKHYKRFLGFLILMLLATIAIIYTGSRGGYLGIAGFYGIFALGVIYYIEKYLGGFKSIRKRYKNLALTVICAGLVFIMSNPAITNRILSIFKFREDSSIAFRMNVYASSFKMFLDNPFLGIGVGNKNFREIYGLYMKTGFDALGSYCVPLEIAVESGIFALISFITFLVLWCRDCLKAIKKAPKRTKIVIFSLILSIFPTMIHGLFDTVWFRPQLQILFWLNVAFLGALKDN